MTTPATSGRLKPLVLVVDDSATYRAAIRQTLERAGYDVVLAKDGDEGLRAVRQLQPDVLVVDRVLPDIDGTAIIRTVRLDAALRRIPCLLITADEDPSVEFTALETGADAYVRKGDNLDVLVARVATLHRDTPARPEPAPARIVRRLLVIAPGQPAHALDAVAVSQDKYLVVCVDDERQAVAAMEAAPVACTVVVMTTCDATVSIVRHLRATPLGSQMPILVMQESDTPADACAILTAGADDYVTRAVGPAVYGARLHALIRRKDAEQEDRRVAESLLRHEAESAAARARAEIAERESRFKEHFLAVMSHELRTPLNAILGFTQLLERGVGGELSDSQRRHVGGVIRSAEHLLALVNDVLDLSKVRAGKLAIRRIPVPLDQIADTARLTVSALAAQRSVALLINVPATLPPVVGDPLRIQQILQNLLSNGVKFTPGGGIVTLLAALDGAMVRIAVSDTGIGIRPEDFPRLFKDFERLEHGQSEQADGTGLGLSLTRHLVELHGGRIEVDSEIGVGSTFTVWLPIAPDTAGGTTASRPNARG